MLSKLKIGLVLDTSLDPSDGVQQYVLAIGGWLSSRGHQVHYLVGQTDKRQLPNLHSLAKNISVKFNGNRTTIPLPTSRSKLRKFLELEEFDVLHVQVPHSPFMAQRLILAADDKTAVVGTFHILPYGQVPRLANHALGIWLRPSLKRFDKMLAVSGAARDFAKESFKIDSDVLPNVVDYSRFKQAKPITNYQGIKLNVLFLGRLVRRKGCLLLLEAVKQLVDNSGGLPDFRVIICGDGHLRASLEQFVDQNKLKGYVEFVGFVDEQRKPSYYASADVAVFPSSGGESFGIVLLEALASSRGVVLAGDNPGYRSVMNPQPELLFDPYNPSELAKKLRTYLSDASLRKTMASWGSDYAQQFDISVVGEKLLAVYQQALRKRRGL